jgi:hypothetical protein
MGNRFNNAQLQAELDEANDYIAQLESKLDDIGGIVSDDDEDEEDDDNGSDDDTDDDSEDDDDNDAGEE